MFLRLTGLKYSTNVDWSATTLQCMICIQRMACAIFSNETITKRGLCEIASYLLDYLREVDTKGVKEVDLFSDGCRSQNKNSVLPSMAIAFLRIH